MRTWSVVHENPGEIGAQGRATLGVIVAMLPTLHRLVGECRQRPWDGPLLVCETTVPWPAVFSEPLGPLGRGRSGRCCRAGRLPKCSDFPRPISWR